VNEYALANLQAAQKHDADDRHLGLVVHLERPNPRNRNSQDDDVIHHVHDSKNEEEKLDIDTLPRRAEVLIPEVADGTTGKSHGDPEDEGVDTREEGCYPKHKSVDSVLVDAQREEPTVEKEDADLDGCDGEGVHEWLGVDDL
jgi:hypothetical protein